MIVVYINGRKFSCVNKLEPILTSEYDYDVITLDGKRHRKLQGKKTNYRIVFYNNLSSDFVELQNLLNGSETVLLTIPSIKTKEYITYEYFPEITSYAARGQLEDGTFFFDGLNVKFDKVDFDE